MIIRSVHWTDAGVSIHWLDFHQNPPVKRNRGKTILHGMSDSRLEFQNVWNNVFWKPWFEFRTVWNYVFQLYIILGKEFFGRNYMWGNVVTILQKGLEWDHHWISEISEVCVIFHLIYEYIAWIDDVWDMLHVNIFWLITLGNHIFSEV